MVRRPLSVDRNTRCAQFFHLWERVATLNKWQMQARDNHMTRRFSRCIACGQRVPNFFLAGLIGVFLLSAPGIRATDELVPPFGFRWNDSVAHVEAVLHGAKAKITSREKKENRELWTVEGLIHPGLKRTVFTFKDRALVAVELQ